MLPCWQSPSEPHRGSGSWSRRRARAGACGRACRRCCASWWVLGCRSTPCWRSSARLIAAASSCARPSTASSSEGRSGATRPTFASATRRRRPRRYSGCRRGGSSRGARPRAHTRSPFSRGCSRAASSPWRLSALVARPRVLTSAALAGAPPGRCALIFLALNPVFLFTSGSAVAEPLMTALLAGASLAAIKRNMRLAALLAALAAVTATKAWIWIGAAVGVLVLEQVFARLRKRSARSIPAAAWAVPALALLVVLQFGYLPATHSLARGSTEVLSAAARGSVAATSLARLVELATTYGLAALPLFVLGIVGLVGAIRPPETAGGPVAIRFLHVPALVS